MLFVFASGSMTAQPTRLIANRLANISNTIDVCSFSHEPDEERLLVVTQDGRILVYDNGVVDPAFLDLGSNGLDVVDFGIGSEEGLLSIALDPDYATNGHFYVVYNGYLPDGSGSNLYDWHLVRFRRSFDDPYIAEPNWWEEVLTLEMPRRGHNGGAMYFGADGYLYVTVGDGGSTGTGTPGGGSNGDADNLAQNLGVLLGKMMRLDVSGAAPYAVPADNPFVGVEGARPEIWSYGFRNPWRWSFDRATGDIFLGDVGEVDWEEINHEPAGEGGRNYGWRLLEGPMCYEPVTNCDPGASTVLPAYAYPHDGEVCSVIGGFMYRGSGIPTLQGHYLYSDACGFGEYKFWTLTRNGGDWVSNGVDVEVEGGFVPWQETRYGFGEDNRGEVYICTRLALYRIFLDPDDDSLPIPDASGLLLYPNPARHAVNIDMGGELILEELQIFDLNGRMVSVKRPVSGGIRYYTFSVQDLPSGMYVAVAKLLGYPVSKTAKLIVRRDDD